MSENTPAPPADAAGNSLVPPPPPAPPVPPQASYESFANTGTIPQYQGQAAYVSAPLPTSAPRAKSVSFFRSLFDFNFNTWVTPKVVKLMYILTWVLLGIYVMVGVIASLVGFLILANSKNTPDGAAVLYAFVGLLSLAGTAISVIFIATIVRVSLERALATIRIAEMVKENLDSK